MKYFLPLFFLFIIIPSSFAFDCSTIEQEDECQYLLNIDENLIAGLLYTSTEIPNHSFVREYNEKIEITTAPNDATIQTAGIIKSAWFDILFIYPSVLYKNKTYIPSTILVESEYDYDIILPSNYYNNNKRDGQTCQILYNLESNTESISFYIGERQVSSSKSFWVGLSKNSTIEGEVLLTARYKKSEYEWDKYCCKRRNGKCKKYCYDCDYVRSIYYTDSMVLKDSEDVVPLNHAPNISFQYLYNAQNSTKGTILTDNQTEYTIIFPQSYYQKKLYEYGAIFTKEPYYFLQITADDNPSTESRNILTNQNNLFVKDASSCSIQANDFFQTETLSCNMNYSIAKSNPFEKRKSSQSWNLLFIIAIFIVINIIIFRILKKTWGKTLIPLLLLLLLLPSAFATEECGLMNLASCIPEKMYDFFMGIMNAPLEPILQLNKSLLEEPPSTEIFKGVWAIMVYIASLFYGFLFMYAGGQFLLSGHSALKREIAKEWLKNTVMMIVLIQASYYLYQLVLDVSGILTSSILSLVNEEFFLLTADNIVNVGLEFFFVIFYVFMLFITVLCLLSRYITVASGVILLPLAIFCYFIPPLRSYGKLILNILGAYIFIVCIDAIIILASSMLLEVPLFENVKILIMISCFSWINILYVILTIKAALKAVFNSGVGDEIAQAVKYVTMVV